MDTIALLNYTRISFFGNMTYNRPFKDITLIEWLTTYSIKNKEKINKLRHYAAVADSDSKKKVKATLAAATISGTFSVRAKHGLKDPTNILCVDIDHIDDLEKAKRDCFKVKGVFFSSLSCSGEGIYCLLKYKDGLDHKMVYNAVKEDFKQLGYSIDKCSDIDRLRFCSYDDNMLLAEEYEEYDKEAEDVIIYDQMKPDVDTDIDTEFAIAAVYILVDYCGYRANDYYEWLNDGFRLASISHDPFVELAFLHISEASPGFKSKADVHAKWLECCRTTTRKSSSISYYYAKLKEKYGTYWYEVVEESKKRIAL